MGVFLNSSFSQHLTASGFTLADEQTVSVWVLNELTPADRCILENTQSASIYHRLELNVLTPTARRRRVFPAETANTGLDITVNVWNHLLFEVSAEALDSIYTNGVDGGSTKIVDNIPTSGALDLAIGARFAGTNPFSGLIAELAVWNRAVTQATKTNLAAGARPSSVLEPPDLYVPFLDSADVQIGGLTLAEQNGPLEYFAIEHPAMFDLITTTALNFDRPPAGVARGIERGMQ